MSNTPSEADIKRVASHLDATLLTAEQSDEQLFQFVNQAIAIEARGICVLPKQVSKLRNAFGEQLDNIALVCVIGFPHGGSLPGVKQWEATLLNNSVDEYDYVPDLDLILSHNWSELKKELKSFRMGTRFGRKDRKLKVILETALLSEDEIRNAVEVAIEAECDFVKTSTGVHAAGGATPEAVASMVSESNGRIEVKASGGINTVEKAIQYLDLGATRLGSTKLVHILANSEGFANTDY